MGKSIWNSVWSSRRTVLFTWIICGTSDLLKYVVDRDYQYALEHIVETEDENVYSKYFQYVMSELNEAYPNTWKEALELYQTLIEVNSNGM